MLPIHALIHIFYLFIIFSHSIFSILTASEKQSIVHFPSEIYSFILKNASFTNDNIFYIDYCKKNNYTEKIFIPFTFIPTKLIKAKDTKNSLEQQSRADYFFDTQLATKIEKNSTRQLRLCNHAIKIQNIFFIYGISQLHFFDGVNENGTAIIAKNDLGKYFYLYCLNATYRNKEKSDKKFKIPLYIGDYLQQESIKSLMLHPEKDTIAFSTTRAENHPLSKSFPHRLTIANIYQNCLIDSMSVDLPYLVDIQKIIYLGKKTYLALTSYHKLITIWQEDDGAIKYCKQKHTSNFIDIAVDNTIKTQQGFKPHIACLNNKYELFVGDLLSFAQPTLFFVKKIPHPLNNYTNNYFFRLFYDNRQCAVIYKNIITRDYDNVLIIPDNLAVCYLKKIMQLTTAV